MRLLLLLAVLASPALAQAPDCPAGDYPPFYDDPAPFEAALGQTSGAVAAERVRAVTVPHHLAVPGLIADGLRRAAGRQPGRIVLLMPDHFNRSPRPFATTTRGFSTRLGPVPTDAAAAQALLAEPDLVADSCLFGAEHGARALLPFIARIFPGVPVLPVAVANGSTRKDWDRMATLLAPLAGPDTLIVQSTDFSHYLPQHDARQRDQEVLNLIAAGDLAGIAGLRQPEHVDSVGALYLTTRLTAAAGAFPVVIANRNLQEDSEDFLDETTSYMEILYLPDDAPIPGPAQHSHRYMLAGDLFLGRAWPDLMYDELVFTRVIQAAIAATRGIQLVANLEGVVLPELPETLQHMTLAMPADLLAEIASRLNLVAVSTANNHADDIGASGRAETRAALDAIDVESAGPGERIDLPGLSLVMLSDLAGGARPSRDLIDAAMLDRLVLPDATVPVVAFVHWGEEWVTAPGPRETALVREMAARGVAAIVGAHPHAASPAPVAVEGGATLVLHSLGNFLFDQSGPENGGRATGALAEITTFPQGTLFIRQRPLPQLYDIARGESG